MSKPLAAYDHIATSEVELKDVSVRLTSDAAMAASATTVLDTQNEDANSSTAPLSRAKVVYGILLFLLASGFGMIGIGAYWVHGTVGVCGTKLGASATFSVKSSGSSRTLKGIQCPGYDWTSQKTPSTAGAYKIDTSLPLTPRFGSAVTPVGLETTVKTVGGTIGYALNGAAIYANSDMAHNNALEAEGASFDMCGGHNSPTFPVGIKTNPLFPGQYHYHTMPGVLNPTSYSSTVAAANPEYCEGVKAWYQANKTGHSPLVGFLFDGVPIYGPRGSQGTVPTDLDQCGGHADDGLGFYHYHFRTIYPYSVECLKACPVGPNPGLKAAAKASGCDTTGQTQYDYSALATFSFTFGSGSDRRSANYARSATVLVFGLVIFLTSAAALAHLKGRLPSTFCVSLFSRLGVRSGGGGGGRGGGGDRVVEVEMA